MTIRFLITGIMSVKMSECNDNCERLAKTKERQMFDASWLEVMSDGICPNELALSYDSIAHIYNTVCPIASFMPLLEAFLKLGLPTDVKILDLCSGTGRLGQLLRDHGGYNNIDALDCSKKSLEIARQSGAYQNYYNEFFNFDANPILSDDMYDVVMVSDSFQPNHLSMKHFAEITRIIKPGGKFVFKIREAYLQSDYLRTFTDDIEQLVKKKIWKPLIDKFAAEPSPQFKGIDGNLYNFLHYIMEKL